MNCNAFYHLFAYQIFSLAKIVYTIIFYISTNFNYDMYHYSVIVRLGREVGIIV